MRQLDLGSAWGSRPLEGGNLLVIRSLINCSSSQIQSPLEGGYSSDNNSDQSEHSYTCFGSSEEGDLIYIHPIDQSQFSLLNLFTKAVFSASFPNHMLFWNINFVLTAAFILLKFFNYVFSAYFVTGSGNKIGSGLVYWGTVLIFLMSFFSESKEPIA